MASEDIIKKASQWLSPVFNASTREQVTHLIVNDHDQLHECFYKDLEFGTGGMRGKMGVGSNRINIYTIGIATQGLSNYLMRQYKDTPSKIAIAYDSRNNSQLFANKAAEILSANGHMVYLFKELRPTPLLSYAVRELKCQAGIVITASHNPKEYNGYKVYWEDGGQLVPPHDKGIIEEVRKIDGPEQVNMNANHSMIKEIDQEIDVKYLELVKNRLISPKLSDQRKDISVVFTSLHGTGITLIPQMLESAGYSKVHIVAEQKNPDGNFPTVVSPNPEERAALDIGLKKAVALNADILLGTDPDADRVGIAVRNGEGEMTLLNGNQAAALLLYFLLSTKKERGESMTNHFIAKTIVTSEILTDLASHFGVNIYNTLTGFKYIAELIKNKEGKEKFIGGGEESYGYLVEDFVRDKDAVISSVMLCEMASWALSREQSVWDLLQEIYSVTGLYQEDLISLTKEGSSGFEEIQNMMSKWRLHPPKEIAGARVTQFIDYKTGIQKFKPAGNISTIDFPKSNVLQFITEDQTKVTVRPSGTEPKIKFYISVKSGFNNRISLVEAQGHLVKKIEVIKEQLGLSS